MKTLKVAFALCALIAFSSGLVAQEEAKKYHFKWKNPQKGDLQGVQMKGNVNMDIEVAVNGQVMQSMSMTQKMAMKKKVTVLASNAEGITKAKVTYDELTNEQNMDAGGMAPEMPEDDNNDDQLVGKTFIVTLADGGATVTDGEGGEISGDIADAVKDKELKDGKYEWCPNMSKEFPDRPIAIGETIKLTGAGAMSFLPDTQDEMEGTDDIEVVLTLKSIKKILGTECGMFDVEVKMKAQPEAGMTISGLPKGQVAIGVKNMWIYKMDIDGDLKMEGAAPEAEVPVEIGGSGKIDFDIMVLYGKGK